MKKKQLNDYIIITKWINKNYIDYNHSYKKLLHFLKIKINDKNQEFFHQLLNINSTWSKEKVLNHVISSLEKEYNNIKISHHIIPVAITRKILLEMLLYENEYWIQELFQIFNQNTIEELILYFDSCKIRDLKENKFLKFNTNTSKFIKFCIKKIDISKNVEKVLENIEYEDTSQFFDIINKPMSSEYVKYFEEFSLLLKQYTKIIIHDNSKYNKFLIDKQILKKEEIYSILSIFSK